MEYTIEQVADQPSAVRRGDAISGYGTVNTTCTTTPAHPKPRTWYFATAFAEITITEGNSEPAIKTF